MKKFNSFQHFGNMSTDPGNPAIKFSKLVLFVHIYLETKSRKGPIFDAENSWLGKHQNPFPYVICDLKMKVGHQVK